MRTVISALILFSVLVIAYLFGSNNEQVVTINYLIAKGDFQLAWVVGLSFVGGFLICWIMSAYFYFTLKMRFTLAKRKLDKLEQKRDSLTEAA